MKATLVPLRSVIEVLDDELATADDQFAAIVADDVMVKRLTTLPSIGPITATAFVAALDDVSRFDGGWASDQLSRPRATRGTARVSGITAVAFCGAPIRRCSRCWCRRHGA